MRIAAKKILFFSGITASLLAFVGYGTASPQPRALIKINLRQKFQIITGWEATAQAAEINAAAFDFYKEKSFDRAADDLGINRLRLELRVGARTSNANFDALAFVNRNGRYTVVVEADAPGSVAVQNLPAGTCGVSYATEKEADGSASDITAKSGESLTASISAIGILTVCAKNHPANKQVEQNNSNKTIRRKFAD